MNGFTEERVCHARAGRCAPADERISVTGEQGKFTSKASAAPAEEQAKAPSGPSAGTATPTEGAAPAPGPVNWKSWTQLWQVPALASAIALIVLGLRTMGVDDQPHDFDAALAQVEELLASGALDEAHIRLTHVIEPNIAMAAQAQRARFHAAAADWLWRSQPVGARWSLEIGRRAHEQYTRAAELGLALGVERTEAWGRACVAAGEIPEARKRLAALDDAAKRGGAEGPPAEEARRRLLRNIVECELARPDAATSELLIALERYQAIEHLSGADEAWAIEQQAELRLKADEAEQAVNHLLVDMRRLEATEGGEATEGKKGAPPAAARRPTVVTMR